MYSEHTNLDHEIVTCGLVTPMHRSRDTAHGSELCSLNNGINAIFRLMHDLIFVVAPESDKVYRQIGVVKNIDRFCRSR